MDVLIADAKIFVIEILIWNSQNFLRNDRLSCHLSYIKSSVYLSPSYMLTILNSLKYSFLVISKFSIANDFSICTQDKTGKHVYQLPFHKNLPLIE